MTMAKTDEQKRSDNAAYQRLWRKRTGYKRPPRSQYAMWVQNLRRYGLTPEQYEELLAKQDGLCAVCRTGESGRGWRLCIDHDHETGQVRGLLCNNCNRALGLLKDNVVVLRAALDYLERAA